MINRAIAKITAEMMLLGDEMTRTIEEYLTFICTNEKVAEKLLNEDRNLGEFMKKLWSEASTRQKNMQAVMTSEEIIPMLENYYGITEEDKVGQKKADITDAIDILKFL